MNSDSDVTSEIAVYVLNRTVFNFNEYEKFLKKEKLTWDSTESASGPENLVEASGRICYMSFGKKQSPKSNSEYIEHLINMGHESVLEHANWTFLLTGVSRAFTHQLVRHRVGFAFSQLSQQYYDEGDTKFVEPAHLNKNPKIEVAWRELTKKARSTYKEMLGYLKKYEKEATDDDELKEIRRAIKSTARSVLPNATETKIVVTANARALRHFLQVRGAIPGDEEMRRVSAKLLEILKQDAPSIFYDYKINQLDDGTPIVIKKSKQK